MGARVVPIATATRPASTRRVLVKVAVDPVTRRAAVPVFVLDRGNRCPDCHSEAFTVGRVTAECGGCGLPLAIVGLRRLS
jgi:nitrogen-specific signal transduction histidine kinase